MKKQRMNDSSAPRDFRAIAFALAAAAPIAAGCSFLERPAPSGSQYMMVLPAQQPVAGSKLGTAMVARFSAIPPFDERRFLYKTTDVYARECERAIAWDDPTLAIAWPLERVGGRPQVAPKDAAAPRLEPPPR